MRKIWVWGLSGLWLMLLFVPAFPLLALGIFSLRFRLNVSRLYAKAWARGTLFVAGVKVVYEGREHLGKLPAIYAFNHTNSLDFFVNACFAPKNCLVFGKAELARAPFLGWVWYWGGHPLIRRDVPGSWQKLLDWVAELLATGEYCTMVAPEGTRSKHGKLLPFKKGPFHFARQSGAPMIPLLITGGTEIFKRGTLYPGTVRVRLLEPIPTTHWSEGTIDEHVAEVRAIYLRHLPEAGPDELPQRSVTHSREHVESDPEQASPADGPRA